ncbi:MAG: hypothetical protein IAC58_01510 [Firmicutes bacterium]|uniref:Uncharacterized protein n=1 Tax=Candidatus Onthovivens merdipullorum TaxID=2840889 RepID=A0A9D9GU06_9BACL|nr:hypothetical protein [Candidatus Onthovivens merdipullorum]
MEKSKNKIILYSLLGLSIISLAGVGFSSWVINNTKEATTDNFSITFGEVVENSITTQITSSDLQIRFDALSDEYCTNEITNGEETSEDLNYSVSFTLTSTDVDLTTISLEFAYSNEENFKSTLGGTTQYIDCTCLTDFTYEMPDSDVSDVTATNNSAATFDVTYGGSKLTANVTVSFSFKWGSVFGENNNNPCTSTVDNVVTKLKDFENAYSAFENTTINLKITPSLGN